MEAAQATADCDRRTKLDFPIHYVYVECGDGDVWALLKHTFPL